MKFLYYLNLKPLSKSLNLLIKNKIERLFFTDRIYAQHLIKNLINFHELIETNYKYFITMCKIIESRNN